MDEALSMESDKQSQARYIDEIDENEWLLNFEGISDELHSFVEDPDYTINQGHREDIDTSTPRIGMEFSNSEVAYEFYKCFAIKQGFATRKFSSKKGKDGILTKRYFVCNKEGFKRIDKRELGKDVKRKREIREFCKAHMTVQLTGRGNWCIKSFYDIHTHPMIVSPKKKVHLRSHNKLCHEPETKLTIDEYHRCGIGPAKISRLLNEIGQTSNKITPQQISDHLRVSRKSNIGRECTIVLQKFLERQAQDSQFYYAIEIDDNQVCRSIFWADGRTRNAYMSFGDVVVFDVTYRTNSFLMPFAPFTGVNHHMQSTLFGCALLADEREETFIWLFRHWLKCMWNKPPEAIITDQDPAIRNAIRKVFPHTHHRFCKWHLGLHEDDHIRSLRSSYNPEFDIDYYRWSKKSRNIEESERCWTVLKEKYQHNFEEPLTEKQKNEIKSWRWLENMHEQRHHWVRAYLGKTFFAGMKSSQRSESMNAFFDGFVHCTTPLSEFVDQYEAAIDDRRSKEEKEDFTCMTTKPNFGEMYPIEAHAGEVYTRSVLKKFMEEFKLLFHCRHKKIKGDGDNVAYEVTFDYKGKVSSHTVGVIISDYIFVCTCAKFENAGLLCKHILYVMKQKFFMKKIPERYIIRRWTLCARYTATEVQSIRDDQSETSEKEVSALEAWKFRNFINQVYERAVHHRTFLTVASNGLHDIVKQFDAIDAKRMNLEIEGHTRIASVMPGSSQSGIMSQISIRDPYKCKTKGRPKTASRIQSGKEISQKGTQKKQRTCKICDGTGHDARNCPKDE